MYQLTNCIHDSGQRVCTTVQLRCPAHHSVDMTSQHKASQAMVVTQTSHWQAQELPGLDALNSDGVSIRQLMQSAMEEHVAAARAKGLSAQRCAGEAYGKIMWQCAPRMAASTDCLVTKMPASLKEQPPF